jgi:hypothetical protein
MIQKKSTLASTLAAIFIVIVALLVLLWIGSLFFG